MAHTYDDGQLLTVSSKGSMQYEWSIGKYGSRFFQEIREKRRFVGIRCPECGKVYVPPRRVCGPCFKELDELIPLPNKGKITAFTVVNMSELEALKTVHLKLKIAGSTVVAWPRGQRTVFLPDANGFYHLALSPGEGVFVEVE